MTLSGIKKLESSDRHVLRWAERAKLADGQQREAEPPRGLR
jgi:hypothetical protein